MDTEVDLGGDKLESSGKNSVKSNNSNNSNSSNLFSSIGSIATQAASDITGMIANIRAEDVKQKASNMISAANNSQLGLQKSSDSYDDLNKQWQSTAYLNPISRNSLGYMNPWKVGGSALAASAQGFAAGASLGPIGAGVSAAASAATSLIGNLFKNKKIKEQTKRVNQARTKVNQFNQAALSNRALNIGNNVMSNLNANYSAYGGPINGAIGYNFMQQSLLNDQQRLDNQINRITSMPNSFMNEFALGGQSNGGYFSNGLTYIGEGGTHEQNPYGGVLMGHDEQGTPNLVEEGEYIWDDYVFSNRLKVPKQLHKIFRLGSKKSGYTFAEAVDFIQKESEERPNDPISNNALKKQIDKLIQIQENIRQKQQNDQSSSNMFWEGGDIVKNGVLTKAYKEGVLQPYLNSPGDYLEYMLDELYWDILDESATPEQVAIYKNLSKNPDLSPFLNGSQSVKDITDEFALQQMQKAIDSKYSKNGFLDLATYADAQKVKDNFAYDVSNVPIRSVQVDSDGNVQTTNIQLDGQDLLYSGSKRGLQKWLNEKDSNGVSRKQRLDAMGYNTEGSQITSLDKNNSVVNLKAPTKKSDNSSKKGTEIKTTYKVKTDDGYIEVNGTDLYEKPEYKNYKKANTYTDDKGNITYYWDPVQDKVSKSGFSNMRFAPILGNLGSVITDSLGVTNTPDYTEADAILASTQGLQYPSFTPIGNKIKLDPIDINYYADQVASQSAAAKRQIANQAGLNRGAAMAGLIAADYNGQNAWGEMLMKTAQENNKLKLQESTFNRETDQFNSQQGLQAAMARTQVDQLKQQGMQEAMKLHQAERQLMDTNKSSNLSGLFNSLGELGREQYAMDMINNNKALTYSQLGQYKDDLLQTGTGKKKQGGYLTIKNKRK